MLEFVPKERFRDDIKTPTLIFHGIRQKCEEPNIQDHVNILRKGTGGHVECIEIGNGDVTSIFTPMNIQVEEACQKVKEHPIFGNQQFNVVGLSQGSLIGRYIVESCDTKFPVRNFVTLGGPNNGFDLQQNCDGVDNVRCEIQDKITSFPQLTPYSLVIQSTLGPANYFKDHTNLAEYIDKTSFLPYLNNEIEHF